MLKVPTSSVDICIESPKQNEYVNIVSDEKRNHLCLGHGSYGRVYKAIYRDRPVAVKIIRKINQESETAATRESNILGWSHENVIKILKITCLDDCFTIIMERFPGICLQQLLNHMKIPSWHRIKISIDVVNALHFCHTKSLVHLDVKPQNVFIAFVCESSPSEVKTKTGSKTISKNYVCKLFDFGCSTFTNEKSCGSNQRGTIRYMSPNILQGFNIGTPDDIYSFGITMWQLKSNADPYFNTPSNEVVAYHVVKNNLRPDSQLKRFGVDGKENENENLRTITLKGEFNGNDSVNNNNCSTNHLNVIKQPSNAFTPKTPRVDERGPFKMQFLSTGHVRKHIKVNSSLSSNVVKKLDFNLVSNVNRMSSSSRSAVTIKPSTMVKNIYKNSEKTVDNSNVATLFKDSYQHLSKERKIKIENSYENIYKQCWDAEAVKRPSSLVILELLNSTFHLFD